jgi:hypothetical protein
LIISEGEGAMKKQARSKSSKRSKKALADLAPRNTAGVKGGERASSSLTLANDKTKDAITQNIRG